MAYRIGVVIALVGLVGCQAQFDTESNRAAIVGGDPDITGFQSVCAMEIVLPPDPLDPMMVRDNRWCGCVLVAPQIVLTSAYCVEENLAADTMSDVDLRFGSDYQMGTAVNITETVVHRYYDPELTGRNDVAMLVIDADPGVTPAVLTDRPLTSADEGITVTLVGHGERTNDAKDFGARYKVDATLEFVDDNHIQAGIDDFTACRGDSGAPVFADLGNGPVVIAINAELNSCFANARRTRIDRYLTDFIDPFITRDTVDPCAWQGPQPAPETQSADCQLDCPTRDWDCPLGVFLGGECTMNGECEEGGKCITAADDDRFAYCTRGCDLASGASQCPSPVVGATMACVDMGGGVGECIYDSPSPGAQGFVCGTDNNVCRSGICEETICVDECDLGGTACPGDFTCGASTVSPGKNVCLGQVKSGGGGFCSIRPAGAKKQAVAPTLFGLLLLGGVMFGLVWVTRRRRR